MGIAKEIFGVEHMTDECCCNEDGGCGCAIAAYNEALNEIDQYEISEEAIEAIVEKARWEHSIHALQKRNDISKLMMGKIIAKAIKQNAKKIFVRRGK